MYDKRMDWRRTLIGLYEVITKRRRIGEYYGRRLEWKGKNEDVRLLLRERRKENGEDKEEVKRGK